MKHYIYICVCVCEREREREREREIFTCNYKGVCEVLRLTIKIMGLLLIFFLLFSLSYHSFLQNFHSSLGVLIL